MAEIRAMSEIRAITVRVMEDELWKILGNNIKMERTKRGNIGGFLTETKTQTLSSQEMYAMAKSELERLSDI